MRLTKQRNIQRRAVLSRIFFSRRETSFCHNNSNIIGKGCYTIARCVLFAIIIAWVGQRFFAYFKTNRFRFVQSPINQLYRQCPKVSYTTLDDATAVGETTATICMTTLTDAVRADTLQKLVRFRNFNSLLTMTWPNKQSYCDKHGYRLFDESASLDTTRPPSWSKIRAAQRLLTEENCDWVFWLDADTVIMNSTIRIESFLPKASNATSSLSDDIDFIVTEQKGQSWNAGAWLIRKSEWSLRFLETWYGRSDFIKPKGLAVSGDNDALRAQLREMPEDERSKHIRVPPRCTFNSVAVWETAQQQNAHSCTTEACIRKEKWYGSTQHYHKGDFVAHVAGVDNKIDTSLLLLKDAE